MDKDEPIRQCSDGLNSRQKSEMAPSGPGGKEKRGGYLGDQEVRP